VLSEADDGTHPPPAAWAQVATGPAAGRRFADIAARGPDRPFAGAARIRTAHTVPGAGLDPAIPEAVAEAILQGAGAGAVRGVAAATNRSHLLVAHCVLANCCVRVSRMAFPTSNCN